MESGIGEGGVADDLGPPDFAALHPGYALFNATGRLVAEWSTRAVDDPQIGRVPADLSGLESLLEQQAYKPMTRVWFVPP